MKRGVATPYGITKRASRKNDWKFSPAAFFGRQGLGEVYSAEQVYLGTLGAVKILSLRGDQQARDLIRAEVRISARLRHPHLIPMVDLGFEEEVPYLVMMDAAHGTLRTLHPRSSQVSPPRVVWHDQHIAQALFYAHRAHKERRKEKEVCHDISPPHQSNRSLASGCRNVGRNP
ncbi:MAG: hypothetical protein E6J22_10555 [Chloroflexi bacterium]|nr:MAG: hypothetical protein E6J22_10555 [Chloroflexota bacterium]